MRGGIPRLDVVSTKRIHVMTNQISYNYCVYLNNPPYIDNDGMIFPMLQKQKTRQSQY